MNVAAAGGRCGRGRDRRDSTYAALCLAALVPVLAIPVCAAWLTRGRRQSADSP